MATMDTLWPAWEALQASADEALRIGTTHYFKCIRQAVCDKLALDALSFARLGQKDEAVYDHLVYLMETYREVVSLFESQEGNPAPDLVAGLCDVLNSRMRQFEDVDMGQGNPVVNEKRTILEKALMRNVEQIENLEKEYPIEPEKHHAKLLKGTWKSLKDSIVNNVFPALQVIYQEALERCLSSINDLHNRETANYYTDLLEREWEVLGLIIQVQVKAIESASGSANGVATILTKLREAYQQTGPVISGFRKLMQSAPEVIVPELLREDVENISDPCAELDTQMFIQELVCNGDTIFEEMRLWYLEAMSVNAHNFIITELCFAKKVVATFSSGADNIEDTENDIINGIVETLKIKIESLNESLEIYETDNRKLLESISSQIPRLTGQDIEEAASQLFTAWCEAPPEQESIPAFFELQESLGAFGGYHKQLVKLMAANTEKLEKSALRFKKETLLYEISTYEEILFYSVTRLRDSDQPEVLAAVTIFDETFNSLESLIADAGITVIRPIPHDPFNGKEHEVLTAEEQEGFAKGEIIKTMTSGFKQGDQVIIRANVVAAR
ncbi:MAG: nucleotide exchange factor GrpE [Defluviitaleaceae bacterium]|nr:nucleotide exchange factor GrpE [Defluviitaleaceae bacterium]